MNNRKHTLFTDLCTDYPLIFENIAAPDYADSIFVSRIVMT